MARKIGRAWGNALGGYKFQNRGKGGRWASGFSGSVPSSNLNTKAGRRAAYLKKQERKRKAKTAAKVAGAAVVVGAAGYAGYKNREAIAMATSKTIKRRVKELPSVDYVVGSETEAARDWMRKNRAPKAPAVNSNRGGATPKSLKIVSSAGVAANAAKSVAQSTATVKEAVGVKPQRQVAKSKGVTESRPQKPKGSGVHSPSAAPLPGNAHQQMNPKKELGGGPANRENASTKAAQLHEDKIRRAKARSASLTTLRSEALDDGSNFHGGDFAEETFGYLFNGEGAPKRNVGTKDNPVLVPSKNYVPLEEFGPSKNLKPGKRTHRRSAGQQALVGAARQGARNRKMHEMKYIEGLSDKRYKGGVVDATIKSVLPDGMKTTSEPLYTDGKSPEKKGNGRLLARAPQANSPLGRTQAWFSMAASEKGMQEYEKLAAQVPQINKKYGSSLSIVEEYKVVDKKGRIKKGVRQKGNKYDHPTFEKVSAPWEDILKREGLAPISLGSYRSTNEIAGSLHGAADTIFYGGAFEDESWKFKRRRP